MAQDQDTSGRFIWFIAGAAIGAAVALLYAPASGADTRKYIGQKTKEGRNALSDSGKEMFDRGRELYERGRRLADEAAEMLERGKEMVDKAVESTTDILQK
jgi:gas vesicle protein